MRKAEAQAYREALLTLRGRITGELGHLEDVLHQDAAAGGLSNTSNHPADMATDTLDTDVDLMHNEQAIVGQIDESLQRIEDGKFGECEDCGGDIGEDRLEAIPYTAYCIKCATREERRGR